MSPYKHAFVVGAAVLAGTVSAQVPLQSPAGRLPTQDKRPEKAEVIRVDGDKLTIRNSKGQTQVIVVAQSRLKNIRIGTPVTWCEDDCRTVGLAGETVQAQRLGEIIR